MSPYRYSCGYGGAFLTFSNFVKLAVLGAVLYFGWPIIEAVLIMLPIPDPAGAKDKVVGAASSIGSFFF